MKKNPYKTVYEIIRYPGCAWSYHPNAEKPTMYAVHYTPKNVLRNFEVGHTYSTVTGNDFTCIKIVPDESKKTPYTYVATFRVF